MELRISENGRRYGAARSKKDYRDFGVSMLLGRASSLPTKIDLGPHCGPVRDQGSEGSCTGHAGYAMRMFLANAYEGNANKVQFSPAEIYYLERQLDGSLAEGDCGSTGRTCVQVLNKFGACPESDEPYVAGQLNLAPSEQALQDALKYRAGAYHSLANVQDMKSCLASNFGFIVGFTVYPSFESAQVSSSGLMPVPNKRSEQILGGHEVFFMGYDDSVVCPGASAGAFKVQNSWGTGWGQDGFFWFPYECAADGDVLMDAFIQHLGPAWKGKN